MIKLTILLTRGADLSRDEFINYWANRHALLRVAIKKVVPGIQRATIAENR